MEQLAKPQTEEEKKAGEIQDHDNEHKFFLNWLHNHSDAYKKAFPTGVPAEHEKAFDDHAYEGHGHGHDTDFKLNDPEFGNHEEDAEDKNFGKSGDEDHTHLKEEDHEDSEEMKELEKHEQGLHDDKHDDHDTPHDEKHEDHSDKDHDLKHDDHHGMPDYLDKDGHHEDHDDHHGKDDHSDAEHHKDKSQSESIKDEL